MNTSFKSILSLLIVVFMAGCNGNPMKVKEAHGIGKTTIYVEESFKPLFDTSIYTFEGQNPLAKITAKYTTEEGAIQAFFQKKTKMICITREFTKEEKDKLLKSQIEVRSDKIAIDAVTLIVNPANPDSTLTLDKLKRILSGQDTVWNGLKTGINVVYDNAASANFIYLRKLTGDVPIPKNVFAVKSNAEVINYVKNNKSAIGVIGVNWVSDEDDPQTLRFRDGISVVAVAETPEKGYFKPYQSYIYTKEYPLTRDVWMINRGSRTGLNSGLVLFLTGEKGQLIVQKSSLIPANMVARMIEIKSE